MVPELHTPAGHIRRKFSLDELRTLLCALGDPQGKFKAVLIAGTNGKGSTAATLASILTASGLRTGLYTSPHLSRANERIRIGKDEIGDDAFAATYFKVHGVAERLLAGGELPQAPSYFEILTTQAFVYFAEQKVDVAVLEVGMGGRRGGTMVTLPQHPEANQALGEIAVELGVHGVSAVPYMGAEQGQSSGPYFSQALGSSIVVNSPLRGAHQHRNLALAIAAALELARQHCADGVIVVSGSVYLVGEARGLLLDAGGLLKEEGKVRR